MTRKLTYAVGTSYSRYWLLIVLPTLVWGVFPLFYAYLPGEIRSDLSLPLYGMLMVTRGTVAVFCFGLVGWLLYGRLRCEDRRVLGTFFGSNRGTFVLAALVGLLLCRLFEALIFKRGEFAFALIFCVALTPFAERLLAHVYVAIRSVHPEGICRELADQCVEWPSQTAIAHTWLRMALLALVVLLFLYAKEGYLLVNPVDKVVVPEEVLRGASDRLPRQTVPTEDYLLIDDPWTGGTLSDESSIPATPLPRSRFVVLVRPAKALWRRLFSAYVLNLALAFVSATCLQFYYHLLDVLGSRFSVLKDAEAARSGDGFSPSLDLTKVCLQQTTIWGIGVLCWSVPWLSQGGDRFRGLGLLLGSWPSALAWIGGVGLLGTVACYFSDNFGIEKYTEEAKRRELPVSASKWAGIATTLDPVISLLLVSAFGVVLKEHVCVPVMAGGAALAMGAIFLARFQETATEVYERTKERALRSRAEGVLDDTHPSLGGEEAGRMLGEYMAIALDDTPARAQVREDCDIGRLHTHVLGQDGIPPDTLSFLEHLSARAAPRLGFCPAAALCRVNGLGPLGEAEGQRADRLRSYAESLLQCTFPDGALFLYDMGHALRVAGANRRTWAALPHAKDAWDVVLVCPPDWDDVEVALPSDTHQRVRAAVDRLTRICTGTGRIAAIGVAPSGLNGLGNIDSVERAPPLDSPHDVVIVGLGAVEEVPASSASDGDFRVVIGVERRLLIDEQFALERPWADLSGTPWARRGALARAALRGTLRAEALRASSPARVLIVEDSTTDFCDLRDRLTGALGPGAEIRRYQPSAVEVDTATKVCGELETVLDEWSPDAVLFDAELLDEGFAYLREELQGVDLARHFQKRFRNLIRVGLISRALLPDISRLTEEGILVASKRHGLPQIIDALTAGRPSLFAAALAAYMLKAGSQGLVERLMDSPPLVGTAARVERVQAILREAVSVFLKTDLLTLPEFRDDMTPRSSGGSMHR